MITQIETTKKELLGQSSEVIIAEEPKLVNQDYNIDSFLTKRQEFISKVNTICIQGQDYHEIKGKKSLAKGGAEKIASIFNWVATFNKDEDALSMLGDNPGLVAFTCTLKVKGEDTFVGEGRGAASLKGNAGDPNKTLKMAQKSAFIDGVLRASGLSDFFTQDLEDMKEDQIQEKTYPTKEYDYKPIKASEKQMELITQMCKDQSFEPKEYFSAVCSYLGFKSLTGGKDGSASKVIGFLMEQQKTYKGQGMSTYTVWKEELEEFLAR